jgi:hypothetical protein
MNVSLISSLGKQLQSTAESVLSPLDAGVLRTWLEGWNECDAAAELKVSVPEIRAAREQLLRRIHVTIDPPSS